MRTYIDALLRQGLVCGYANNFSSTDLKLHTFLLLLILVSLLGQRLLLSQGTSTSLSLAVL